MASKARKDCQEVDIILFTQPFYHYSSLGKEPVEYLDRFLLTTTFGVWDIKKGGGLCWPLERSCFFTFRGTMLKACIFVGHNSEQLASVLWCCWLGVREGIRPVKTEWWVAGMVICLERGADLHVTQLMPLLLTVSCFSEIQIGLPFWYRLTPGGPGKRAVKHVYFTLCRLWRCWRAWHWSTLAVSGCVLSPA